MTEIDFIRENKEKWRGYEKLVKTLGSASAETVSEAYHDILADLAYANTQFPYSRVRTYLTGMSKRIHERIYKPDKFSWAAIWKMLSYDVPYLVVKHRKTYMATAIVFSFFVVVGIILQLLDINSLRETVGSGYVEMTIENINAGKPCAVYNSHGEFESFWFIVWNNLSVAFKMYAAGLVPFFGPLVFLKANGVMLGEFQTFFFQYGAGLQSMTSIWIHGSIEIPSIIIEATAALILSTSLVFPGTYTRMEAIKRGGTESVKVLLSSVPVIITAGFFEGYITRRDTDPLFVRLLIIFTLFGAWVYYYVILPMKIYRKEKESMEISKIVEE